MAYVYADLIKKGTINPKTGKPYTIDELNTQLTQAQVGLTEVYEMLLSASAQ